MELPPHDELAERCVIGSVMMEPDASMFIASSLKISTEHFYVPANAILWKSILTVRAAGKPVSIVSILADLRDNKMLDMVGGQPYIESTVDDTPTSAHMEYYCKVLHKKFLARKGQEIVRRTAEELYRSPEPNTTLAQGALSLMQLAESLTSSRRKEDISAEQKAAWENASKGGYSGIPTPWNNINARFQGLQNGAVTLLAGRGGRGKSSMLATWGHFLGGMGYKVGWLPLEDGCRRTWARISGIEGNFSTFRLDTGKADNDLLATAFESLDRVQSWPIFLEDQPMTVEQICAWATMQKAKNGIDVLFVDAFKDIMRDDHDVLGDNQCSQQLAALAKRLYIPILVNHHVRKQGVDPKQQYSKLTEQDIRGSGRLSDDARQIIILQNYVDNGIDKYSFHIIKNNYGPVGEYPLIRLSNISKFVEPITRTVPAIAAQHVPYHEE